MISLHNILSISRYERKTLFRSWFFRIFSGLALIVLFLVNMIFFSEAGMSRWIFSAIPSTIPYFNLLVLNVAQAIIAVFLASDFLKRDKKLDTTEVIYMRPMSNSEYVMGKTWGNIEVFIFLNILILAMALVFNFLAPGAAINTKAYVLYLFLISIPTLIFIVGLSFFAMSVIQNQAVTFVIILGYIGITLFVLQEKYYFLFDYMAFKIPMLQSDIVGFGNLKDILIHRGIYLSLGIGCIFLTMYLLKRLPQSEFMTKFSLIAGILFIVAGLFLGYTYVNGFKKDETLRSDMISLNNKYFQSYFPDIVQNDITLTHKGSNIDAASSMLFRNNSDTIAKQIVIHLNPGLEVSSVLVNDTPQQSEREKHLLIIDLPQDLLPGGETTVTVRYSGTIDEAACYLDIDREKREEKSGDLLMNADKRFAFMTPDYVLLTAEANWYPIAGVSYTPDNVGWDKKYFTRYTLSVTTDPALTAISQGSVTTSGAGNFSFAPEQPLPQISLVIGKYEKKTFSKNNTEYSLWYVKGHDFFSKELSAVSDTLPAVIAGRLDDMERNFDLEYAYDRISLVEVPAQFKAFDRSWISYTEIMQPEQVLMQEKAYTVSNADFRFMIRRQKRESERRGESVTDRDMQIRVVNNFLECFTSNELRQNFTIRFGGNTAAMTTEPKSPYYIFPQLYNFQNNIYSSNWPVMNRVFESYLKNQSGTDMRAAMMRQVSGSTEDEDANIALQDESFVDILTDPDHEDVIESLISLKGQVFFAMLQSQVGGEEELNSFLKQVLNDNKFNNLSFSEFENMLQQKYNVSIGPFVRDWFNKSDLPAYLISDIKAVQVKAGDQMKTMVTMKVSNVSDVEGIIKVSFRLGGGGFGGGMMNFGGGGRGGNMTFRGAGGFGGGSNVDDEIDKTLYLKGNETKEFSYLLPSQPRMATINTLTSRNIPQTLSTTFAEIETNTKAIPFEGEFVSDVKVNTVLPGEIIVDNEDSDFTVTRLTNTNLLRKLIVKEDESTVKYAGANMFRPPSSWTATTNSGFYGSIVRSAYYIKSGDGNQKATWTVPLKESGYYDVYYYVYKAPNVRMMRGGGGQGRPPGGGPDMAGQPGQSTGNYFYYFTISHDGGTDEQTLNLNDTENGWALLGSFEFSGDSAVIQLSNKCEQSAVYADAVKLVKL